MNRVTIREYICDLRSQFAHIDAIVFTSFTFDGGFFENNVLPALFDIEDRNEPRRRRKVNEALLTTECTVFFDGNNRCNVSGKYRYLIVPIQFPKKFFHPKNVIIAGQDAQGVNMVYVSAASANLTLSGWGRQEEVISSIFLASARLENQIGTLRKFLTFIQARSQGNSVAVQRVLKCLDGLPDLPRTNADQDTDLYFGGLAGVQPFARILLDERDGHRWDELFIVSPYWHDVANQIERFPCQSYVLIPAKGYPSLEDQKQRYGLTLSQLAEIKAKVGDELVEVNDFSSAKRTSWLFRHAKAYFAIKNKRLRAGIGSCNFTDAGLSGEDGNVESMIVSDLTSKYIDDLRDELKNVRLDEDEFESHQVDDAPQRLPFIVLVVFDWKRRTYSFNVEIMDEVAVKEVMLYLPGVESPIMIRELNTRSEIVLRNRYKNIDNYRISYVLAEQPYDHIGPIVEINMDDTEKEYTRTPEVDEILQSWSSSDESWEKVMISTAEENEDEGISSMSEENDKSDPGQTGNDILSYYDIFRAFYDLRAKLKKALGDKDRNKLSLYLERRSDSVKRLANSLETIQDKVRKYLILVEIGQLTEEYERYLADLDWSNKVKQDMTAQRNHLQDSIYAELRIQAYPEHIDAQRVLGWFDSKFKQ